MKGSPGLQRTLQIFVRVNNKALCKEYEDRKDEGRIMRRPLYRKLISKYAYEHNKGQRLK